MSPRKKKKSKKAPVINLPPLEVNSSYSHAKNTDHNIDPRHAAALEEHIKSTLGGSMVSVCL